MKKLNCEGAREDYERMTKFSDSQKKKAANLMVQLSEGEQTQEEALATIEEKIEDARQCTLDKLENLKSEGDQTTQEYTNTNINSVRNNVLSLEYRVLPGVRVSVSNSQVTITLPEDTSNFSDNDVIVELRGEEKDTGRTINKTFKKGEFGGDNTLVYDTLQNQVRTSQVKKTQEPRKEREKPLPNVSTNNMQSILVGGEFDSYPHLKRTIQLNSLTVRSTEDVSFDHDKTLTLINPEASDDKILAIVKVGEGETIELKKADFPYEVKM